MTLFYTHYLENPGKMWIFFDKRIPSRNLTLCYGKWWFSSLNPLEWVIFHSYVSLPEGIIQVPSGKLTPWNNSPIFGGNMWKLIFQPRSMAGSLLIYWRVLCVLGETYGTYYDDDDGDDGDDDDDFFWKNVQIINPIPRVPGSKMEQRINGSPCSLTRSQWELGIEFPSRMRAKRIFGFLDNDG